MSYANNPSSGTPAQTPKSRLKAVYLVLIVVAIVIFFIAPWGYIIYDKTVGEKTRTDTIVKLQTEYFSADSSSNAIKAEYYTALAKMDSLTGSNAQLKGTLADQKNEIDGLKEQIRTELAKKNADLTIARKLVDQLKDQVMRLFSQIDELKEKNVQLTTTVQKLQTEKDTLAAGKHVAEQNLADVAAAKAHVEDVGSTLHASAVNITAMAIRSSGKEVETSKANKADLFKISFQLDENRIAPTGLKQMYVCVTGPDGKPITMPSNGSGTFTTRDEGEKVFTKLVSVEYTQGQAMQVSFDWKPEAGKYAEGDYKVQIYQNGFKIGQATITLKKAGFLG